MKIIKRTIVLAVPDHECPDQAAAERLMDELIEDPEDGANAAACVDGVSATTVFDFDLPFDRSLCPSGNEFDSKDDESKAFERWYEYQDEWESTAKRILTSLGWKV